jgi:hypothetical protein
VLTIHETSEFSSTKSNFFLKVQNGIIFFYASRPNVNFKFNKQLLSFQLYLYIRSNLILNQPMKKFTLLMLFALTAHFAQAQCSACTPVSCSATKPLGGLCNQLPDDTAGKYYENVVSFYMPKTLTDPATLAQCSGCSSVTLKKIKVVGVQGLPPGLSYSLSNGGIYDVANNDSLGCMNVCGTPIAPGTYYMVVNLLADVVANGVPVVGNVTVNDQPQQYRDTIEIFPGTSACPSSFDLGGGSCVTQSCDPISVNLNATQVNAICPNLISYDWSFGNGQTSKLKTPGAVNYSTPDTFPLSLTTTFYTYRVKSVFVNITGGYTGDVEELSGLSNPDPYIRINSLAFNNRGTGPDDTKTANFTNLNLIIPDNNCATPIEIQVWDEDTGLPQGTNPLGSQDDLVNTHSVTPGVPNQVTSALNNSNIAVTFDTVATSSLSETINIIVHPVPPVPAIAFDKDSICNSDSTNVSWSNFAPGFLYNWYLNDTIELLSFDSSIVVKEPGSYTLKITNTVTGCSEFSAPKILAVGTAAPTSVNIIYNGTSLFVSPFPSTGFAVRWFYNGNFVSGQSGKFLPFLGPGTYDAEVYNTAFPECATTANTNTISNINEVDFPVFANASVYPNPNSGNFTLAFEMEKNEDVTINVSNTIGQTVYEQKLANFTGQFKSDLNLTEFGKGVYVVTLQTGNAKLNKKVVVQ